MMSAGSDDTPKGPDNDDPDSHDPHDSHDPDDGDVHDARGRLSPALVATLVAVPIMVIAGFITFAALRPDPATPIESYASQGPVSAECTRLLAEAPETFEGFGAKEISGDRATWPAAGAGDNMTLRCGVARPAELAPTSNLQEIHASGQPGVQWFITDTIDGAGQAYVCVDHRPYVAMWVPATAGNGPITDISGLIARVLDRGPLDFG
ncbi:DUF3515 family protein [Gordonia jinghuaiqii]|uniref:DUF3515 domain-containing protein n=1 Tax=Gordonia jinghuaiqii TaxID=2758710 RepID=A0A7D7R8S0_9ACTN|nr:DUF3515 domain-containing protein [Gordonia jinghuaiqii]MCR5977059.1 DUF3515 family protein [Gordonia jinghuaiqii]QMT00330.1 DUF3515 domain-containing protein [Gordonia jinghuaiqii]